MKINHNNKDLNIYHDSCLNCYFHDINYFCAILPYSCWINGNNYKISTKNSDIFKL